jgi:hypothetical protein
VKAGQPPGPKTVTGKGEIDEGGHEGKNDQDHGRGWPGGNPVVQLHFVLLLALAFLGQAAASAALKLKEATRQLTASEFITRFGVTRANGR